MLSPKSAAAKAFGLHSGASIAEIGGHWDDIEDLPHRDRAKATAAYMAKKGSGKS